MVTGFPRGVWRRLISAEAYHHFREGWYEPPVRPWDAAGAPTAAAKARHLS
jgi:hypothetical protein